MASSKESKNLAIQSAVISFVALAIGICNISVGCEAVKKSVVNKQSTHGAASPSSASEQDYNADYIQESSDYFRESSDYFTEPSEEGDYWADTQPTYDWYYPEQTESVVPEETVVTTTTTFYTEPLPEETRELQYDLEFTDDYYYYDYDEYYDYYEEPPEENYYPDVSGELCLVDLLGMTVSQIDELLSNDSWGFTTDAGLYCRTYDYGSIYVYTDDYGTVVEVLCFPGNTRISKVDEYGYNVNMTVSELCSFFEVDDLMTYDEKYERYYAYFYSDAYLEDNIAYFYSFDNDEPNTPAEYVSVSYVY